MKGLSRPIWPVCTSFLVFLFILTFSPVIIRDYISPAILISIGAVLLLFFLIYFIRCHLFSELFDIINDDEEER